MSRMSLARSALDSEIGWFWHTAQRRALAMSSTCRSSGSSVTSSADTETAKKAKPQINADEHRCFKNNCDRFFITMNLRLSAFIRGYRNLMSTPAAEREQQSRENDAAADPDEPHQRVDVNVHRPPLSVAGFRQHHVHVAQQRGVYAGFGHGHFLAHVLAALRRDRAFLVEQQETPAHGVIVLAAQGCHALEAQALAGDLGHITRDHGHGQLGTEQP